MNDFCKTVADSNISFDSIGKLTSLISKAIVSAHENNVKIDDVITEKNIISAVDDMKNGSKPEFEIIRLINKANIKDKIKILIIADIFS